MSLEEVDLIFEELKDPFGSLPESVEWLYQLSRLKVFASQHGFTLVHQDKTSLSIERQHGKQTVSRKLLMSKPKNPQEIESKVVAALKREFKI